MPPAGAEPAPPPRERVKPRLSAAPSSPLAPPPPPEPEPVIPLFSDPTKPDGSRFAATAALALAATPEPGPAVAPASAPPPPAAPAAANEASATTPPHAPGLYITAAPAPTGKSPYPRPLHLHLEGEVATEVAPSPAPVKPEEKPAFKYGVVLVFLLAVTVIGGGAFLILRFLREATATPVSQTAPATVVKPPAALLAADKPTAVAPVAGTTTPSTPPPASGAAEEPSSPMGRALAKAREVTGQAVVEKGTVEEIVAPSQVAPPSDPLLPEPRSSEPSRGVVVVDSAATSPEYIAFVEATRISGVFQGATPRALINGRTVRVGTLIDVGLGVYFHGLDTERRQVVFRDSRGLIIRKGY